MSDAPLDQVNRFIIVIVALAVIFAALLGTMLAWGAPDGTISRISDLAGYLGRHNDRETKVIISLGAAIVTLLMLVAIIVELTPSPTQSMRVRGMRSGGAVITTTQIATRINVAVGSMPNVGQCAAVVAARGRKVEVVLDLHVDAGANLAQIADEACARAHAMVEEELGMELAAMPRARLHYRELRLREDSAVTDIERSETGWERPGGAEGERDERG